MSAKSLSLHHLFYNIQLSVVQLFQQLLGCESVVLLCMDIYCFFTRTLVMDFFPSKYKDESFFEFPSSASRLASLHRLLSSPSFCGPIT